VDGDFLMVEDAVLDGLGVAQIAGAPLVQVVGLSSRSRPYSSRQPTTNSAAASSNRPMVLKIRLMSFFISTS
jgi:hypothetical protein